ncbi:MAG: hypothetical protein HKN14_10865 [Marinicaulis sp.]|nr:hypothetical protein [Marinicaulis sp.]NNE41402.1 hypothetical protein [Marinicaulis sp.]NNL89430.1 hypothetical protein [Marinicaulis sp.]
MRIIISLLIFLAGIGSIGYSYIGSFVSLAGDVEKTAAAGDDTGAVMQVINFVLRGEAPQLMGFLYAGMLLIAIAVVNMIVTRPKSDDQ